MTQFYIKTLVCLFCFLWSGTISGQTKVRKTVFILVDGIPADVLETVATPALDSLAKAGKYMRSYVGGSKGEYSESPTISAVGYNSLLTGTWANKHNVWDNDIAAPNYHYPTIFRLLKNQYPAKKIGIFSSWLDNRTKLIGDGLPQTGNIQVDYHADGYELDTIRFPQAKARDFMHKIDNKVVQETALYIRNQAPDLSWVYLEYTDDMGHMYGDSKQFYDAVKKMDAQISTIAQAVQYRQKRHNEDWLIVVTTDHGRDEQTGKDHGGQSYRQRSSWIVTNYPQLNMYAKYYTPGIVDIMPTIARFMNISMPLEISRELDGTPLTGKISLAEVQVHHFQKKLDVSWKALEKEGKVKIWVSTTNGFKTGEKDTYTLFAEVPVTSEHASIHTNLPVSSFYKVVLESPFNSVTKWVTLEAKQK
ncbi:alkaline phosphatase family protein [Rhodocytophaga rosea]|uniref:Alkaline phosphatase family protein n=1 Tax=Rhodocytophaga rosea TaxID=2704465 RepID=A0A6C0GPH8_9BACT|nr:alkaline phosphatase family protein [Rhodocytophaga rosea]QHT69931.1 alkaline phosphatase family protein [Rhodocytophaga rosea]